MFTKGKRLWRKMRVKFSTNIQFIQLLRREGMKIGDNCIIAANETVTKDIPPNSVVAGSLARIIGTVQEFHNKHKMQYVPLYEVP